MDVIGADRLEWRDVAELIPYARNARTHSDAQVGKIAASIGRFGFNAPVLVDGTGGIIAGHGRVMAAKRLGMAKVPVVTVGHLTEEEKRAYILADNRLAEEAGWDKELLTAELQDLEGLDFDLSGELGFSEKELAKLLERPNMGADETPTGPDPDAMPEESALPVTARGDLWRLGDHLVLCGDSASDQDAARLLQGAGVDTVLSDPPFCSGGFQEAGRSVGGIGRREAGANGIKIANDALSSRGYQAMIGAVLRNYPARIVHLFTDWRMWVNLFDVMESSGYGVRSMICWDKGSAGLGWGWRAQHEMIMCGVGGGYKFDKKAGRGNVIQCKRTRNELHPTQKPVELLEEILDVLPDCQTVADPFGGSGTTLMACERKGRVARVMELEPRYVDVIVRRWQEFTGLEAMLDGDGRTFAQIELDRRR